MFFLVASVLVLFLIFELVSRIRQQLWGWRASIMMASLTWGSILTALTELLHLYQKLDFLSLAFAWGFVFFILLGMLLWLSYTAGFDLIKFQQVRKKIAGWMKSQDRNLWIMLAALGVQAILLCMIALAYAPNTYESMTYQLPRVMHWLQHDSLANFATSNVRETYFPPFSEYIFLHLFALSGGDRFVNLVQWGAFLLSLVGVSAISAELGAKRNTQIATALLSAGIPIAVLEATTARNDVLVSLWLVSLAWFGLRWIRWSGSWLWATMTGLSLGLALLTKATGFIYALPIGFLIGVLVVKNGGLRTGLVRGGFTLLLALVLNLGHLNRNWTLYGDPMGAHERVGSDIMSPAVFVSNSIRNLAMHVPSNCEPPLAILNQPGQWLSAGFGRLHALTGLSPTDPRTTWGYVDVFQRPMGCVYNEHFAGNPMHALLIFAACLAIPFLRSTDSLAKLYALALVLGFILLNLVLRWQVWGSHLQLPLFVLWMPIIALALARVRQFDLPLIAGLLAVALSFLWIYNNELRPLSSLISGDAPTRDEQYFSSTQVGYSDYDSVAGLIVDAKCDRVGLRISSLALEYPLWVLLSRKGFDGVVEHIDVVNESSVFENSTFVPCAVVSDGFSPAHAVTMTEHSFGIFRLYLNEMNANP
jgi:4-amino-4-deoxy-L-arabinose transferase-like glycosyltransferase